MSTVLQALGTLRSILPQAGLTVEEFIALL